MRRLDERVMCNSCDKDLFQLSIDINLLLEDLALLSPECVEFAELKTEIKKQP